MIFLNGSVPPILFPQASRVRPSIPSESCMDDKGTVNYKQNIIDYVFCLHIGCL